LSPVRVERHGPRTDLTWERPPWNVFDRALLEQLTAALGSAEVRRAHVVTLAGAGRKWSAGLAVDDHLPDRLGPMLSAFRSLLEALAAVPVPTIARVEGPCLGGGVELVLPCDIAYAATSASFGQPEIRLGVFPPLSAVALPSTVGPKRAAELLYRGEPIDARRAEAIGLITRAVPDDDLPNEVDRAAGQIGAHRREALVLLKRALRGAPGGLGPEYDRAERIYLDELMELPHADEGLRAFLEKRPAVWPAGTE
jgi:cyclohexa-1,5-dienecarbonyl-CoA hydratase